MFICPMDRFVSTVPESLYACTFPKLMLHGDNGGVRPAKQQWLLIPASGGGVANVNGVSVS